MRPGRRRGGSNNKEEHVPTGPDEIVAHKGGGKSGNNELNPNHFRRGRGGRGRIREGPGAVRDDSVFIQLPGQRSGPVVIENDLSGPNVPVAAVPVTDLTETPGTDFRFHLQMI